jgi:hypothetical protein
MFSKQIPDFQFFIGQAELYIGKKRVILLEWPTNTVIFQSNQI